jgi:FkbM family methyltransferase
MRTSSLLVNTAHMVRRSGLLRLPVVESGYRSAYFLYKRWVEDPFAPFVQRYPELLAGGHILDVGAHIGYNCSLFATTVDAGCKVFAFEPDPENFAALESVIRARALEGLVVPLQMAVGASSGHARLWRNPVNHADHRVATEYFQTTGTFTSSTSTRDTIDVELCTIDAFMNGVPEPRRVSFVKIDAQGYEGEVLAGLRHTVTHNPGITVAFEYAPDSIASLGFAPLNVRGFFTDLGFAIYTLQRDGRLSPADDRYLDALHGPNKYVDLVATRRTPGA